MTLAGPSKIVFNGVEIGRDHGAKLLIGPFPHLTILCPAEDWLLKLFSDAVLDATLTVTYDDDRGEQTYCIFYIDCPVGLPSNCSHVSIGLQWHSPDIFDE